jgi:8-oxo-dGTP pyrophosphatase MutT (NUDIX family)
MKEPVEIITQIHDTVRLGLPGREAHFRLSPAVQEKYYQPRPDHRKAGVLFLLYPKEGHWHTCYIKRSSRDERDKHAGQIGLPGGKLEKDDIDMAFTSLRETEEEIGVNKKDIQLVTPLTTLYVFASNFLVYPHVGIIDYTPQFIKQEEEVDEIVEISLQYLVHEMNTSVIDLQLRDLTLKSVPYYDLTGHVLWGATSMITSEFRSIMENVQF